MNRIRPTVAEPESEPRPEPRSRPDSEPHAGPRVESEAGSRTDQQPEREHTAEDCASDGTHPPSWQDNPERRARAALSRLIEPGDAVIGRWLGQVGAVSLIEAIQRRAEPGYLDVDADRLAAYQARLPLIDVDGDLERVRSLGGRFIIPGDSTFCVRCACCPRSRCVWSELCWVSGVCSGRVLVVSLMGLVRGFWTGGGIWRSASER